MSGRVRGALVAALVLSAAGFLCGVPFAFGTIREASAVFPVAAGLAAFVVAFPLWWLILGRSGMPSAPLRGAIAGGSSGLLAHPICWVLYLSLGAALESLSAVPEPAGSTEASAGGLLGGLPLFALGYSLYSVLVIGPFTAPAGALVGAVVASLQASGTVEEDGDDRESG